MANGMRGISPTTTEASCTPSFGHREGAHLCTGPSPIRLISDIGPVKGSSNPDLTCGLSAQKAELVVPANPGSVFTVQWVGGDGTSNWPHNTGPLMTYMASCGSTTCDQFDASGAKWFKIDQLGLKSDGSTWNQADISTNRSTFDVTLPQNLSPGGYLIRHEIIALHLAVTVGGAEFYPMCTQVMIGGNGNGTPQSTVSFPGAYSDTDPGIYDPDIYNPGSNYTFPGGPVSNLAGSDASMAVSATMTPPFPSGTNVGTPAPVSPTASMDTPPSSETSADAIPSPSPTGTGASSDEPGSTCSLKARSGSPQKRHFKRFLRRAMPHASH
ncbi:hypothetical protein PHLCEN_2v5624 [Hermanssonia centrifuga]|uniref:lytic cellulose monooxygenase (C4-dehydrogenating) n=1 Tax=Hermanssonia centrifuga TaxID=98765 RepID=A0A2R6P201_9APHY|nr:hypothetical protein PHLCEN_2v5624 [Hermanssonia centrifuga]